MHVITASDVTDALTGGLIYLSNDANATTEPSRNGPVRVAHGPVATVYRHPRRRVLRSPLRDANPFFHLMEAVWMLSGRNDLYFPQLFNSGFGAYSDDGHTLWGAYGWRWREFFGHDQLDAIVEELRANPNTRRCVLAMWNAATAGEVPTFPKMLAESFVTSSDFWVGKLGGKDVPCNTHAYIDVRGGKLNLTVCCRSNDIIWGAYGANVVHFSILQEYLAACVGVPMGTYTQFSNNYHLYTQLLEERGWAEDNALVRNLNTSPGNSMYTPTSVRETVLFSSLYEKDSMDNDIATFFAYADSWPHAPDPVFVTWPFRGVVLPMFKAYMLYKDGDIVKALEHLNTTASHCSDWVIAGKEWLLRREARRIYNNELP